MLASSTGGLAGLITQLLTQLVSSGRQDVLNLLDSYLLSTTDTSRSGGHPLTSDPILASLNHDVCLAADALLALVVLALLVRGMFEHTLVSQHDIRAALPRIVLAVLLMHASLSLSQMAVDLSNALSAFASGLGGTSMPWTGPLASSALTSSSLAGDLFQVLVLLALVVIVAILGFTYVMRMAVLQILIVTAPLAALALILPSTAGLARVWTRVFVVALSMQPAQLLVLSVATATGLAAGGGLAADIYALAAIWVTLKVPAFLAHAFSASGSAAGLTRATVLRVRGVPSPAPARSL